MPDWDQIFMPSVPLVELFVRGTVMFLALSVMMRIVGQRESGGIGITDLMVVVLVAEAANAGLAGDAKSIVDALLLVAVILFWSVALDAVAYRWLRFATVLKSRPKPLIEDGRLNRRVMRREFMTYEEVLSQLRLQGLQGVDQVSRAFREPNGMVSGIPKKDEETQGAPESLPCNGFAWCRLPHRVMT
jgi:uncharacterized membrane protein YcaP (DUF421 family)